MILAAAFPTNTADIERLRSLSPAFDDCCADYVTLAKIVGHTSGSHDLDDVFESLAGLRQDIRAALKKHKMPK